MPRLDVPRQFAIHACAVNGTFGYTAAVDGLVKMWNLNSSQLVREFEHKNSSCSAVSVCPDNRLLFVGLVIFSKGPKNE